MSTPSDWPPGEYPPRVVVIPPPTNGFAITALVSSLVIAPLGIIFGHLALRQIRRTGESGRGLAIGGIVIGCVATTLAIIAITATVVALNSISDGFDDFSAISPSAFDDGGTDSDDVQNWLGTWTGTVDQSNYSSYTVRITLSRSGQTVEGTVSYPELECSGTLDNAQLTGGVLYLEETITVNTAGRCITETAIELTLGSDSIHYHFDYTGGVTGDGTLRRV